MKVMCLTLNNIIWVFIALTIILFIASYVYLLNDTDAINNYKKLIDNLKDIDEEDQQKVEEIIKDLLLHDAFIFKMVSCCYSGFCAMVSIILLILFVIITLLI